MHSSVGFSSNFRTCWKRNNVGYALCLLDRHAQLQWIGAHSKLASLLSQSVVGHDTVLHASNLPRAEPHTLCCALKSAPAPDVLSNLRAGC